MHQVKNNLEVKNMKLRILILCLVGLLFSKIGESESLKKMEDSNLAYFIHRLEILEGTPKKSPFSIEIIRFRDLQKNCPNPVDCKNVYLYIHVSTYDEDPDFQVYQLPEAHSWTFDKWVLLPKKEYLDDFLVFKIIKWVLTDVENDTWKKEVYEVKANPWKASYEKL